ncbi:hypothetical protein M413DRAFT_424769 [Hebeloma cylindrosporum]|uniref:Uncharacterized protein n=1 Tax=Hebeloma cylindrosporum TaxID=76867 RepID=A0A0C2Y5S6_HEBCY|nr:hypothetical protein M413DRAFT_424769 [Hebeloma cylindrosporum h7]
MTNMFRGLQESSIEEGKFTATGDSKMFEDSKKLDIGGGFFSATNKDALDESSSEDDRPEMFKGLEKSRLTDGTFISEQGGKMFENSRDLIIDGGEYIATSKRRKGRKTTKPFQQGYGLATNIPPPPLQPQSVPVASSGFAYRGVSTASASVPLMHTQTAPALPSDAQGYFPKYDVPNHRTPEDPKNNVQGSTADSSATAMDVDVNNGESGRFDEGKEQKDRKFGHGIKKIWKKHGE